MTVLLALLAVPVLATPFGVASWRLGRAAARIVLAGLALSALWQGMGTLLPSELRELGRGSADAARFIALTAGFGIGAIGLLPRRGVSLWAAALGWPLAVGLFLSISSSAWPIACAGVAAGLIPALAGALAGRRRQHPVVFEPEPVLVLPEAVAAGVATAVVAWRGPILATAVAAAALSWWTWQFRGQSARWSRWPVLPTAATLALMSWAWLAITIAGTVVARVRTFAVMAPVSPAAEVLIAGALLVAAILVAVPWPLQWFPRSAVAVPTAALLVVMAREMAPAGAVHWLPLFTGVAVVATVAALAVGRLGLGAGSLVLLASARAGVAPLVAAIALAAGAIVWAIWGWTLRSATPAWRANAMVAAGAMALAVVMQSVLADEVVWAVVLAVLGSGALVAIDRLAPRPRRALIPRADGVASPDALHHLGPST